MKFTHPELAAELLPNEFGTPLTLLAGTHKQLPWMCKECDHIWTTSGSMRKNNGTGCPYCAGRCVHVDGRNSLATVDPDLADELVPGEYGGADDLTYGSSKRVQWQCKTCDYQWAASPATRRRSGCPACANKAISPDGRNSMRSTHPRLAAELLPNTVGTPDTLIAGTSKKLPWRCSICAHEWSATGNSRLNRNCPACAGKSVHSDGRNSLAVAFPEIAKELCDDKHLASELVAGSHRIVNWRCSVCSHNWKASLDNRVRRNSGCPACANKVVHEDGRNSMAQTHPAMAMELLENKHGSALTLVAGTNHRLPWLCSSCGHKWVTTGGHRAAGQGCPVCFGRKGVLHSDGSNSMRRTHPELAIELLPNPYGTADTLIASTTKPLPWKCSECGNEWIAPGSRRVHQGSGCSNCAQYGFNPAKPAYYYSMRICSGNDHWWWKGGVSCSPEVRRRNIQSSLEASGMHLQVTVVESLYFHKGSAAMDFERQLLEIKEIRVSCSEKFDGANELFRVDPIDYARLNELLPQTRRSRITDW